MNWKTVRHLIGVDVKSGRMMRGQRLRNYTVGRSRFSGYYGYLASAVIGAVVGGLIAWFYTTQIADSAFQSLFATGFASFQIALPLIIVIVTLVFMMMQQLQRSGANLTRQAPYWLPVTWQEHTLASIVAEVLGIPLISLAAISPAVLIIGAVAGQEALAVGSVIAMFAAAFMAGATAEIIRLLQTRFTGAVYKTSGKAAIWVRFLGTIIFFIIFYIVYFYIIYGTGLVSVVSAVASAQGSVWFVPFVWPGMTLYSFLNGLLVQGFAFLALSAAFILGMYCLAVALNVKYGLYEPPAIKVSAGVYAPKAGMMGKFGFSTVLPVSMLCMTMGGFMTGEEGQSVWRIYISPVSAKAFVKSKLTFVLLFVFLVLPITSIIGFFIYHPTSNTIITMIAESIFFAFALSTLSLANGIRGADFTEVPRPRMMRVDWSFLNMGACILAGLGIIAPLAPYLLARFILGGTAIIGLLEGLIISGVIAAVMAVAFYLLAVNNAKNLLARAEV